MALSSLVWQCDSNDVNKWIFPAHSTYSTSKAAPEERGLLMNTQHLWTELPNTGIKAGNDALVNISL